MATDDLIFYHAPNTRSSGVLTLLEELQAEYQIVLLDFATQQHKQAEFLSINPMGKVPTIVHQGHVITEQIAVYQYLAELFPDQGLAPLIGDAQRGAFLRWLAFYGCCFEPAIIDRSAQHAPDNPTSSPYGDFDTTFATVVAQLTAHPYIAGDKFSAADVLWGSALGWITQFGLVPETDVIADYVARVTGRPSFAAANQKDSGFAKQLEDKRAT